MGHSRSGERRSRSRERDRRRHVGRNSIRDREKDRHRSRESKGHRSRHKTRVIMASGNVEKLQKAVIRSAIASKKVRVISIDYKRGRFGMDFGSPEAASDFLESRDGSLQVGDQFFSLSFHIPSMHPWICVGCGWGREKDVFQRNKHFCPSCGYMSPTQDDYERNRWAFVEDDNSADSYRPQLAENRSLVALSHLDTLTTADAIGEGLREYGEVSNIEIIKDSLGVSSGVALVCFSSSKIAAAAYEALKATPFILDGKEIQIEYDDSVDSNCDERRQKKRKTEHTRASEAEKDKNRGNGGGFVYDTTTAMYINRELSLGYDPKTQLYYNYQDKCSYEYDEAAGVYNKVKEVGVSGMPAAASLEKEEVVVSHAPTQFNTAPAVELGTISAAPSRKQQGSEIAAQKTKNTSDLSHLRQTKASEKKITANIDKWTKVREDMMKEEKAASSQSSIVQLIANEDSEMVQNGVRMPKSHTIKMGGSCFLCLVCCRQFESQKLLEIHISKSDIHKKRFKTRFDSNKEYFRARIAERKRKQRELFLGVDKKAETPPETARPPEQNLLKDSIGAKIFENLGWKGGSAGEIKPFDEIAQMNSGAGIGLQAKPTNEKYVVLPSDSYKAATRKRMLERWENLQTDKS